MRIRFPILLSAAILVAAILLVFRDELHARGPHTLNRLDGSVTQCERSQQNFSPAIATVGLKFKWGAQAVRIKPLQLAVLLKYYEGWSNPRALTILDARGRPPNVRSSSQPIVRPRSRGSLPRLPLAASVAPPKSPPNRYESPNLAPLRHADCIKQCPLSGVTRKTFAHPEFFSV